MQTLNVNYNCQVSLEKTLTLPIHEYIILNSMTQTREKLHSRVLSTLDF